MNPLNQSKNATILPVLVALTLGCFGLSPTARAVDPPPDGGYANGNTAEGENALFSLTTGFYNTAVGYYALYHNTSGTYNNAVGSVALGGNTTGNNNTAIGQAALYYNSTGSGNTAIGAFVLEFNNGNDNTAIGIQALTSNQSGSNNTAIGDLALADNSTGSDNTATGSQALFRNRTGINNTADGVNALNRNTAGNNNIALGVSAGTNLTKGNNNIYIGNAGNNVEHNKIRIGSIEIQKATFIAGISGVTVPSGVGVIVGTDGKLGTVVSSERFKDSVEPMAKASEAILALKPVTFRYKHELDPAGIPQFGLVAEQVEKVNPDLVVRDAEGKPYTVRYEAVNAMLLNEFLKEHRKVESLEKAMCDQQKENAAMRAMLKAQAAQIQKVSDQLTTTKPAPRLVVNNQ